MGLIEMMMMPTGLFGEAFCPDDLSMVWEVVLELNLLSRKAPVSILTIWLKAALEFDLKFVMLLNCDFYCYH